MSWTPISNTPPQYEENGIAASGYYIKFYESGTTTPTAMATDSTGTTTLDKCELDSEGYPINGSGAVFIPHINVEYKIALFRNAADADANDLNNAVWDVDALFPLFDISNIGTDFNQVPFNTDIVYPIKSVQNLAGLIGTQDDQQISMKGWHPDSDTGGGLLYWDSAKLKSAHNGDKFFSPTVPFSATTKDYLDAVGETEPAGSGCWVRISTGGVIHNITAFGVVGGGVIDETTLVQAAINSGLDFIFDITSCLIAGQLNFSSANQNIYLNGCELLSIAPNYLDIAITANDVTIDLGGGVIDQGTPWGEISADVAAGSTVIPLLDTSRFNVGDIIVSSWGSSDGSGYPLVGPTAAIGDKKTVVSKTSTTITLSSAMDGTNGLPQGLKIGDFAFSALSSSTGKRSIIKNGILDNVRGFYYFSPNNAAAGTGILFNSIYFATNGVDQLLTQQGQLFEITNSRIEQNMDVAKTGLVMGNSQVRMSNVTGFLGNYDATILLSGTKADHTDSSLVMDNCEISGATSLNKSTTVGGDFASDVFTPIEVDFQGVCAGIRISNTYFKNYTRHLFSSLTDIRTGSTTINHAIFDNVKADCSMYNFIFGAGGVLTIPTFTFDNCDIFQTDPYILGSIGAVSGGVINAEPTISSTTIRAELSADNYNFDGGAVLNDCKFQRVGTESTFTWAYNKTFLNNCEFQNTKLAISPTFSTDFVGYAGSVTIDHPDFPHNPNNVINIFGTTTEANGARVLKAKSKNGSVYYNVFKWFGTGLSTDFYMASNTFNFTGDDYYIPKGCRVIDMLEGLTSPVTYGFTANVATAVSSGTTLVIDVNGGSGNRPAALDHVNIVLDNGRVFTSTVAAGRAANDGSTTFVLDDAIPSLSSVGNKVQFFRY